MIESRRSTLIGNNCPRRYRSRPLALAFRKKVEYQKNISKILFLPNHRPEYFDSFYATRANSVRFSGNSIYRLLLSLDVRLNISSDCFPNTSNSRKNRAIFHRVAETRAQRRSNPIAGDISSGVSGEYRYLHFRELGANKRRATRKRAICEHG